MSKKIYLVCMEDGTVIDVITAESFEEAYGNTVGRNHGHCVIELSDEVLRKIMEKLVARGWYKKEV